MNIKKLYAIAIAAFVVGLLPVANGSLGAQGYGTYYSASGPHPIYYGNVLNYGASRGSPGSGTNGMPDVSGRFINHTHTMHEGMPGTYYGYSYLDSLGYGYPSTGYLSSGGLIRSTPLPPGTIAPMDYRAQIQLKVPETAEVLFDNQRTSQRGQTRSFSTALLEPGRTYQHEVRVTWKVGDHEFVVIRPIQFQAGNRINLDLSTAEGGYGIETRTSLPSTAANVSGIVRP